jgi:hypothetical protein
MSPKDLSAPPQATPRATDVWGQLDEIKFRTFGQLYRKRLHGVSVLPKLVGASA